MKGELDMYCTHCGSRIDDDSLVCSECGEKVEVFENIQVDQQVQNNNEKDKFKINKRIIIAAALISLFILSFMYINQSNKYRELEGVWQRQYENSEMTVIGDVVETFEFDDKKVKWEMSLTEIDYQYGLIDKRYNFESSYNCNGASENQGNLVIEPFALYLGDYVVQNVENGVVYDYRIYNENGETYLHLEMNGEQYTFKLIK